VDNTLCLGHQGVDFAYAGCALQLKRGILGFRNDLLLSIRLQDLLDTMLPQRFSIGDRLGQILHGLRGKLFFLLSQLKALRLVVLQDCLLCRLVFRDERCVPLLKVVNELLSGLFELLACIGQTPAVPLAGFRPLGGPPCGKARQARNQLSLPFGRNGLPDHAVMPQACSRGSWSSRAAFSTVPAMICTAAINACTCG